MKKRHNNTLDLLLTCDQFVVADVMLVPHLKQAITVRLRGMHGSLLYNLDQRLPVTILDALIITVCVFILLA